MPTSVYSSVFPGPQMPWNKNTSLQLQDMYDQVYAHLIGTSKHRDTMLQILGQCLVSRGMTPEVDILGTPANSSSPNRIVAILGLEKPSSISELLSDIRLLVEVGKDDQDIKIDDILHSFLLDRSRSHGLFIDLDDARLTLKFAAPIRKVFDAKGM